MTCGACCTTVICEPDFRVVAAACALQARNTWSRAHYSRGLQVIGLSQGRRPGQVLRHVVQDRRKLCKRLDAGIPRLRIHGVHESRSSETLIPLKPGVRVSNLVRKGGGSENLGNQRVRVERNGREELLQLSCGKRRALWRRPGRRRLCRLLCCNFAWHSGDDKQDRQPD